MSQPIHFICDFDGTFTDPELEGKAYIDKYTSVFAEHLGMPVDECADILRRNREEVLRNPSDHFFYYMDSEKDISLPSVTSIVDGMLLQEAAAGQLLLEQKNSTFSECEACQSAGQFYNRVYPLVSPEPRKGAVKFLQVLNCSSYDVTIITNSDTQKVKDKIDIILKDTLLNSNDFDIRGGAQKYALNPDSDIDPSYSQPEGFPYPVDLRRDKYLKLLESIISPDQKVYVIGDIWDFDLALPANILDATPILMTSSYTPSWIREYFIKTDGYIYADDFHELTAKLSKLGISF